MINRICGSAAINSYHISFTTRASKPKNKTNFFVSRACSIEVGQPGDNNFQQSYYSSQDLYPLTHSLFTSLRNYMRAHIKRTQRKDTFAFQHLNHSKCYSCPNSVQDSFFDRHTTLIHRPSRTGFTDHASPHSSRSRIEALCALEFRHPDFVTVLTGYPESNYLHVYLLRRSHDPHRLSALLLPRA